MQMPSPRNPKKNSAQRTTNQTQQPSQQQESAPRRRVYSQRPPAPGSRRPPQGPKKGMSKEKKFNIMIGSIIGVLVLLLLVIILVIAFSEKKSVPAQSGSNSGSMIEEDNYDKGENSLPLNELAGTILPETEDAGEEYIKDTLFLGDSNTVRMLLYRDITKVTLNNAIGVEGMGIQSVPSFRCVEFKGGFGVVTMPEAVKLLQPRRVVLTFGTNNAGGISAENFVESYKESLDAIKKAYPYADIIIGAVPPIHQYHTNDSITMTIIDKFNIELARLAEKEGYKFLNWSEVLKDPATGFCKDGYTISDGIHLSREAMSAMFKYVRTHSYITEDTRPKPITGVPEVAGVLPIIITKDPANVPASKASSSSSALSSSSLQNATVSFSVYNAKSGTASGGKIVMGDSASVGFSVEVPLGGTCPNVTAVPDEGYVFAYWTCTVGTLDPNSPTLSGFKIFPTVKAGEVVGVTAVFEKIAETPSSSQPESQPIEINPPSSLPPTDGEIPPDTTSKEDALITSNAG